MVGAVQILHAAVPPDARNVGLPFVPRMLSTVQLAAGVPDHTRVVASAGRTAPPVPVAEVRGGRARAQGVAIIAAVHCHRVVIDQIRPTAVTGVEILLRSESPVVCRIEALVHNRLAKLR